MYEKMLEESRAKIAELKAKLNQTVTEEEFAYYQERLNVMDMPKLKLTKVILLLMEINSTVINFCSVAEVMELQIMIAKYLQEKGFATLHVAYFSNASDAIDVDMKRVFQVVRNIYLTGLTDEPRKVMEALFKLIESPVIGICQYKRLPEIYGCDIDGDVLEIQVKNMVSDLVNLMLSIQ